MPAVRPQRGPRRRGGDLLPLPRPRVEQGHPGEGGGIAIREVVAVLPAVLALHAGELARRVGDLHGGRVRVGGQDQGRRGRERPQARSPRRRPLRPCGGAGGGLHDLFPLLPSRSSGGVAAILRFRGERGHSGRESPYRLQGNSRAMPVANCFARRACVDGGRECKGLQTSGLSAGRAVAFRALWDESGLAPLPGKGVSCGGHGRWKRI